MGLDKVELYKMNCPDSDGIILRFWRRVSDRKEVNLEKQTPWIITPYEIDEGFRVPNHLNMDEEDAFRRMIDERRQTSLMRDNYELQRDNHDFEIGHYNGFAVVNKNYLEIVRSFEENLLSKRDQNKFIFSLVKYY